MSSLMQWDTTRPGRVTAETVGAGVLLSVAVHGRYPARVLVSAAELEVGRRAAEEARLVLARAGYQVPPMEVGSAPAVLRGEIWLEVARDG